MYDVITQFKQGDHMPVRRSSMYLLFVCLFVAASSFAASPDSIQLLRAHRDKIRVESKSKAKVRPAPDAGRVRSRPVPP